MPIQYANAWPTPELKRIAIDLCSPTTHADQAMLLITTNHAEEIRASLLDRAEKLSQALKLVTYMKEWADNVNSEFIYENEHYADNPEDFIATEELANACELSHFDCVLHSLSKLQGELDHQVNSYNKRVDQQHKYLASLSDAT